MRFAVFCLTIFTMGISGSSFSAEMSQCGSSEADSVTELAGVVENVTPRGSVSIRRANRRSADDLEKAKYRTFLCADDEFVMSPNATITVNVYGKTDDYKAGDRNLKVPRRDVGFLGTQDRNIIEKYWPFVVAIRRQVPTYTWARTPGEHERPAVLVQDVLAPTGRQFIPREAGKVVVLWRGGPSSLTIRTRSSATKRIEKSREAWAVAELALGPSQFSLGTESKAVSWSVERRDEVPSPPWFPRDASASEGQRLVRAIWLFTDGPPEWRLFALTEIYEIAKAGNFVAMQFWHGARSGELDFGVKR